MQAPDALLVLLEADGCTGHDELLGECLERLGSLTSNAGCAFSAATKVSVTPMCSCCSPQTNHTPPLASYSGGLAISDRPSSSP